MIEEILSTPLLIFGAAIAYFVLSLPKVKPHRLFHAGRVLAIILVLANVGYLLGEVKDKVSYGREHVHALLVANFTSAVQELIDKGQYDTAASMVREFNKRYPNTVGDNTALRKLVEELTKRPANKAL